MKKKKAIKELTPKLQKFAEEYLLKGDGQKAAIAAGFAASRARQTASRLLTRPDIKAYIKANQVKLAAKYDIPKEKLLKELAKIAFSDIKKLVTIDGAMKSLHDLDPATAGAIASLEIEEEKVLASDIDKDEPTFTAGTAKKVKLWDKIKAIETINKMLGYNEPDKVDHTTKGKSLNTLPLITSIEVVHTQKKDDAAG